MTLTNWKLAGCLAIAGMLMLPMAADAQNQAGTANKANKATALKLRDLPHAAAAAIVAADRHAKVHSIFKVHGTKHNAGKTYYVAHLTRAHQHATVKVSANGRVVRQPKWHDNVAKVGSNNIHKKLAA